MSYEEPWPTFDTMRYLAPWHKMVGDYGLETTIDNLITWHVLNRWDEDHWPQVLVMVFGEAAAERAKVLKDQPKPLVGRFQIIEGENYPERVRTYCERVLKEFDWWSIYDP